MEVGNYKLRDVEFEFAFDGEILYLFPKDEDNKRRAKNLTHKKLGEWAYSYPGDPIAVEDVIELFSVNHNKKLILYPTSMFYEVEDLQCCSLSLEIGDWFLIDKQDSIQGLSISSNVLNLSFDIQKAIDSSMLNPDGTIKVVSRRNEGQSFKFNYESLRFNGYLSYARSLSVKPGELPIKLKSHLSINCDQLLNPELVRNLADLMHGFIAFVAQGFGYEYEPIELLKRYKVDEENTHTGRCSKLEEPRRNRTDIDVRKAISVSKYDGLAGMIFQSLSDGTLVLGHLPMLNDRHSYTPARLIMSLAALDKTLETIYIDGIQHSDDAIESKNAIIEVLDSLNKSTIHRRTKDDVKWLKKILNKSGTFQARLEQLYKDHDHLFKSIHGQSFDDEEKCKKFFIRITALRNKVAHGEFEKFLDCDFDDIKGINRVLLASQLVMVGVKNDEDIAQIVNDMY